MALLIWGRRLARRPLGWVADYCPVCRGAAAFELEQVQLEQHVYGISSTRGAQPVDVEICCSACGVRLATRRRFYKRTPLASNDGDIERLIKATQPRLRPRLVEALWPLRPTHDELEQVLDELRGQGVDLARRIDPRMLLGALARRGR